MENILGSLTGGLIGSYFGLMDKMKYTRKGIVKP